MARKDVIELKFRSSGDGSLEKALLHVPRTTDAVPLVVGLHTWSYDRFNQLSSMLPYCRERGWALLLPEFRGPNLDSNPRARQACASALARQDILDAVGLVVRNHAIDSANLFLLGGSGGGHMVLMMAATAPRFWKGVSSWVPITDLAAWYGENPEYAGHVAACLGGEPGSSPDVDREYRERSPIFHVEELAKANLYLHHGRLDPLVDYRQSWRLAQKLEEAGAERFYFEIFNGGHDIQYDRAFTWFDQVWQEEQVIGERLTG